IGNWIAASNMEVRKFKKGERKDDIVGEPRPTQAAASMSRSCSSVSPRRRHRWSALAGGVTSRPAPATVDDPAGLRVLTPLWAHVFEPLLRPHGALAGSLGPVVGAGPGAWHRADVRGLRSRHGGVQPGVPAGRPGGPLRPRSLRHRAGRSARPDQTPDKGGGAMKLVVASNSAPRWHQRN